MLTSNAAMSAVAHFYDFISNCANKKHSEVKVVPSSVILRSQNRPQNAPMPKSEVVLGTDVLRTSIEEYLTSPDLVQFTSVNRCINKNRKIREIVGQRINKKWIRLSDLQEIFDAFVLQKKTGSDFNRALSSLPKLTKITILDLSSPKSDKPLVETRLSKMRRLFKRDTSNRFIVTDQIVTTILERCPNLNFIDLTNNKITDTAVLKAIQQHCPNMEFIYGIRTNDIDRKALWERCPKLKNVVKF